MSWTHWILLLQLPNVNLPLLPKQSGGIGRGRGTAGFEQTPGALGAVETAWPERQRWGLAGGYRQQHRGRACFLPSGDEPVQYPVLGMARSWGGQVPWELCHSRGSWDFPIPAGDRRTGQCGLARGPGGHGGLYWASAPHRELLCLVQDEHHIPAAMTWSCLQRDRQHLSLFMAMEGESLASGARGTATTSSSPPALRLQLVQGTTHPRHSPAASGLKCHLSHWHLLP